MSRKTPIPAPTSSRTPFPALDAWLSGPWHRRVGVIFVFLVVYGSLQIASYRQKSATFDEPLHLTAGYLAVQRGDYRLDPTHPPLLRMWAALPLTAMVDMPADTTPIDRTPSRRWTSQSFGFAHDFLYRGQDADRLLYAARFMVVLLGAALGLLLWAWAWEWLGPVAAVGVLGFYLIEPNLSAHATLVTTDAGLTLFYAGTVYFLWRTTRRFSWSNVAGTALCFGCAIISKFSGVLLAPVVVALLVVAWWSRKTTITGGRVLLLLSVLAFTTFLMIWAIYGFRYTPGPSSDWIYRSREMVQVDRYLPVVGSVLNWIDAHRLLPNGFTQGFVLSFATSAPMAGYLDGEIRATGWWYYFPVAFLIKTPVALLGFFAVGVGAAVFSRRRRDGLTLFFATLPAASYFAVAMTSDINIGLRHVLPIYPFVLLLAVIGALAIAQLPGKLKWALLLAPLGLWIFTFARVYPHTLTFFNRLVGGPAHGWNYLADSNLDWGQHLKTLKSWMDEHQVEHINLAYFGMADPGYYGINYTYLPGSPLASPGSPPPRLPGYLAISVTTLTGTYLRPEWQTYYRRFRETTPLAVLGNTIFIFKIEEWPVASPASGAAPTVDESTQLRGVADALYSRKKWPAQAALYYEEYLKHRDSVQARFNYAVCLLETDRVTDALKLFRDLSAANSTNGTLHRRIAAQMLNHREFEAAVHYATQSAQLLPHSVRSRILLEMAQSALADPASAGILQIPEVEETPEPAGSP